MPLFSTTDLTRFFNQGEEDLSDEIPFLIDRVSLPIVSGNAIYTIPDYVRSISRLTWMGKKLVPLPNRNFRDAFQPGTQKGMPFWYVFNNTGQNKIQLFPCPNVDVSTVTNVWDTDIPNGVILEYYRIADGINFVLPPYLKNFTLKKYVGKMMFQIEGPGQNLKMSKYLTQQWEFWKKEFSILNSDLHSLPRRLVISGIDSGNWYPGSPMLPIDKFGVGVDTGY